METVPSILLFVLLFGLSAFFSGSEIALMSLPVHKIDSLVKQKKLGAKVLKKIKDKNERLLISILIGNNLVNVFTASLATKISMDVAAASGMEQSLAIGISTGVITLLLLLFGEIFPKTIATRYAEKIALNVAKIYELLGYIFYPVIVSIDRLMRLMHRGSEPQIEITDEEIESFIDMGKESGVFEQGEYEKIKKMLEFYEVQVHEIMTPRVKIEALHNELTVDDAILKAMEYSHSRLPVFSESIDDIEWTITLRDMIKIKASGQEQDKISQHTLKKINKVPLTTPIHKVLELMRKHRAHIALVMDEYGGVAGLVTLEDIMEEVFGDFKDESDQEETPIRKHQDSYIVQSFVRFDDVLDAIQLEYNDVGLEEAEFEGETLGFVLMSHLERFPKEGEKVTYTINNEEVTANQLHLTILSVDEHSIGEVKVEIDT